MLKHRGFPSRYPGTDFQFTLRRSADAPTPLKARERYRDRKKSDLDVDAYFLRCLVHVFGEASFERGNLDAGRLSWLLGREVLFAEKDADPASYETLLKVDMKAARSAFPKIFD